MKHQETSINNPAPEPTTSERGQNPSAEADTAPAGTQNRAIGEQNGKQSDKQADKPGPTANEIMNEQVSPRDEQGNRDQSDKPHIGG